MATNSKEYMKAWRDSHPGKMKAYDDKWRSANPEVARATDKRKQKRHYDSHPEYRAKAVARARSWQLANPERSKSLRREVSHRRRARIMGSQVGPVNFKKVLIDSSGLCGICLKPLDSQIDYDHIIPLVKGGSHTQDNLQATHSTCNRRKNSR